MSDDAFLIGLARTLTKLVVELTEQGALDRQRTIDGLRNYAAKMGDDPPDDATKMWVNHIADVLAYDPNSPKPPPTLTLIRGGRD